MSVRLMMPRQRPSSALFAAIVGGIRGRWGDAPTERALRPSRQGVRVLRQRTAIFAAVLALGLDIGIANAQAIYFGPRVYDAGLPPHEIMRIVRSTGLAPLTRPARRGPYYVLLATNRSGGQMRVVVDAYAGDIVRVNPMLVAGLYGPQPAAPYGPPPRIVTGPSKFDDPPLAYTPNTRFDGGVPPV